ncbi:VWA domain-containing protein [Benzoatithermus flavus]|uniref:VWA domain-containing protein n=1 Tax=Benzoatithermus flavus TaxID=3108223 RepID=A0ABU8XX61_9PROT
MSSEITKRDTSDIASFLEEMRRLPAASKAGTRGRLIFALDATASREPTWDLASHVQNEMFLEAGHLGGLEVQLVFYRGFGECKASAWVRDGQELVRLMRGVRCVAGKTQIGRVLRHAVNETRKKSVQALVFVGDCMEEDVDALGELAGELGLLGVRAFMFHEGDDPSAARAFRHIATLTRGAYCRFASGSAQELKALLAGVAAYAAGGTAAVAVLARRSGGVVRLLEHQLR